MSQQKGKVVRSFEYCLERSQLALNDEAIPELRQEIIHSELSPDKTWREAKRRLQKLRTTAELNQEDETLARSYWWLAKTKRDYRKQFEKTIQPEEKKMEEKEIFIFADEVRTRSELSRIWLFLKFNDMGSLLWNAMNFLVQTDIKDWSGISNKFFCGDPKLAAKFKEKMLRILEQDSGLEPFIEVLEKRGMKVRICGNCKHFHDTLPSYVIVGDGRRDDYFHCRYREENLLPKKEEYFGRIRPDRTCQYWTPKEKEVS